MLGKLICVNFPITNLKLLMRNLTLIGEGDVFSTWFCSQFGTVQTPAKLPLRVDGYGRHQVHVMRSISLTPSTEILSSKVIHVCFFLQSKNQVGLCGLDFVRFIILMMSFNEESRSTGHFLPRTAL